MATLAQGRRSGKDVQAHLRHSKADTTANEYMQELPQSVGRMVESMYEQLMDGHTAAAADLLPNATNKDGGRGDEARQRFERSSWSQFPLCRQGLSRRRGGCYRVVNRDSLGATDHIVSTCAYFDSS